MSNTYEKAKMEFTYLNKDDIVLPFKNEILELVKAFGNSGQSGGSAPYTAGAISSVVNKLCMHQAITPIQGKKNEWGEPYDDRGTVQNKRNSAIFKDKDDKAYFIDAIIFKQLNGENKGVCFNGGALLNNKSDKKIGSKQYIKSFPFVPKTFYIGVISIEYADQEETVEKKGGGWWKSTIFDENQLIPVFEYYDEYKQSFM